MTKAQAVKLSSGNLDLLNQIEELRGRLLHNQGIRERISQRAYELYERRGGEPGRDVEDWIAAENEILSPIIEEKIHSAGRTDATQEIRSAVKPSTAPQPDLINKRSAKSKENSLEGLKN